MRFTPAFLYATAVAAIQGALGLLSGEADGFSIDATSYDTVTAAAYVGGPVGGTVAVINTGDPTDDLSNVALDSSNITQTGTSAKVCHFDTAPYVRWSPHNLCIQSQTFGTTWTPVNSTVTGDTQTAPDGTTTADTLTATSTGPSYVRMDTTQAANIVYTMSVYAKKGTTANYITVYSSDQSSAGFGNYFNINAGTVGSADTFGGGTVVSASITSVGSGWYRCSVTGYVPTVGTERIIVLVADGDASQAVTNGATAYVWGAQVVRGYNANPYLVTTTTDRVGIPQSYDTIAAQYGILSEDTATNGNQAFYSQEFDNAAWTKTNTTVSANATTAPDGSSTADKLVESAVNDIHRIFDVITLGAGGTTYSVYAKAAERSWLLIDAAADDGDFYNWFDLANGVTGTIDGTCTASIVSIGDGWYRCSVSRTKATNVAYLVLHTSTGNNVNSYNGDGSSGLYLWGAQVEYSISLTSYIPTLGSTVVRAQDVLAAAIGTFPSLSTEYSLWAEFRSYQSSQNNGDSQLNLGTVDQAYFGFASANYFVRAYVGGANQMLENPGFIGSALHKVGGRWKANDFACIVDNASLLTDGTGTLPTSFVSLSIGSMTGFIYKAIYIPRGYSNTELQTITTL